jgi:adenine-specific DNA-methyltransferase
MIRAFRDTWDLEIHSYLTYLRDRLLLARDLLHESGSCFVQIGDQNLHLVRAVLDDIFGSKNFSGIVSFRKTTGQAGFLLPDTSDYLIWYAKEKDRVKFRQVFLPREGIDWVNYDYVQLADGSRRKLSSEEKEDPSNIPPDSRVYRRSPLTSASSSEATLLPVDFGRKTYTPGRGGWKTNPAGFSRLAAADRLEAYGVTLSYRRYAADFPYFPLSNAWTDTASGGYGTEKVYVVQTNPKVIARCLLMTTDPGDLVLDPTCGSGTTAYIAEEWGRRWITCDTSRVAITLAKQRLMAANFDYYELAHTEEGIGSGFRYKTVPHVTLKSIANNPEIREGMTREQIDSAIARYAEQETLYDQPYVDRSRVRVSGPFTMEAVPAPTVRSLDDIQVGDSEAQSTSGKAQQSSADFRHAATPLLDASVARSGPTLRHTEWRDELLKTGLRGKGGHHIDFSRVEPLAGTRWLHADAETKGVKPERVVISFGPEHSLLEQRQVELAWEEARTLSPKPAILVFAAFEFDPEAAKDIDELTKEKTGMTFLTAQMNADLLTEDLKKKRASNQSFWLVGRPDVDLRRATEQEIEKQIPRGLKPTRDDKKDETRNDKKDETEWYVVEVRGFDYYNTRTGTIDSGDTSRIAMWLFDPDYDGRSLYPRQVFFPMADEDGGWARLARNLKAEIDPELIEAYRGTTSLPFEPGPHKRVAVKVIDDRGIESLKVVDVK